MNAENSKWNRPRLVKAAVLALMAVAVVTLVCTLNQVFIPVGIALLIAYVIEPVINWLDLHHTRRIFTVVVIYVSLLATLMLTVLLLGPTMLSQFKSLMHFVEKKSEQYNITWFESMPRQPASDTSAGAEERGATSESDGEREEDSFMEFLLSDPEYGDEESGKADEDVGTSSPPASADRTSQGLAGLLHQLLDREIPTLAEKAPPVIMQALKALVSGAQSVIGYSSQFVLTLFYAFFFMIHFPAIKRTFSQWFPYYEREKTQQVLGEIDDSLASFFRGRLIVCVIASFVMSTGLLISGIEYWLILGIAAGFLGIIPFIGVILAMIPIISIALLSDHPIFQATGAIATMTVVQSIVEPIVGSFVLSREVKCHPVTIIVSFLAGGALFGVLGVFLAVPTVAVLKILGRHFVAPLAAEFSRGARD